MKVTVLGSGASNGVPAAGGFWGNCDPQNPRNERSRASILVQSDTTDLLFDTSYDLRLQLNRVRQQKLDAVFLSHAHSDHINGIDDLRAIAFTQGKPLDIYADDDTLSEIRRRWPYLIQALHKNLYKPFLHLNHIENYKTVVADITVNSFVQDHYTCKTLGFRINDFAYSVDVVDLDDAALEALKGIKTWVVDAGGYHVDPPTTHANLKRIYKWVEVLKPEMTYLTVLSTKMDYDTLCQELPDTICPAYDGLILDI